MMLDNIKLVIKIRIQPQVNYKQITLSTSSNITKTLTIVHKTIITSKIAIYYILYIAKHSNYFSLNMCKTEEEEEEEKTGS